MHRQIRELAPALGECTQFLLGLLLAIEIEMLYGLAYPEIAGGNGVATAQAAREQPIDAPTPDAVQGQKQCGNFFIRLLRQSVEIEPARADRTRQSDDVFGFFLRELQRTQ